MRKFFCILVSVMLLLANSVPAYATTNDPVGELAIEPRIPMLVIAETTTEVWRYKPRETVDNEKIAIAPAGTVFSYIRDYIDPTGEAWYYVSIISIDAPGSDDVLSAWGYVSQNDTRLEIRY